MSFDMIVGNGSVVTASDTFVADVAIANGKIVAIVKIFPSERNKSVGCI